MDGFCPEVEGEDFPSGNAVWVVAGFKAADGVLETIVCGMRFHEDGHDEIGEQLISGGI